LNAHGEGAALRELNRTLAGKVAGAPDLRVLRPHPAGTTEQGAL
jgi:hypothetical protein